MTSLPPDDQPFGDLVPTTSDAAADDAGEVSLSNPVMVAMLFASTLAADDQDLEDLVILVTVEAEHRWPGFEEPTRRLRGLAPVTRPEYHPEWAIAYVRFVPDSGQSMRSTGDLLINGGVILTLLWSEDAGMWLAHDLGDYWRPQHNPRSRE